MTKLAKEQISNMTVKGIKEYMKENNIHIVGSYKLRKAELIEALVDYLEATTEEQPEVETVVNEVITVSEIEVVEKIQLDNNTIIEEPEKQGIFNRLKTWINSHKKPLIVTSIVATILSVIIVNINYHNNNVEEYMVQWEQLQDMQPDAEINEFQMFWFGDAETILSELESINATNYGTENNRYYIVKGDEVGTNMVLNFKIKDSKVEGEKIGYGSDNSIKEKINSKVLKELNSAMKHINKYNK